MLVVLLQRLKAGSGRCSSGYTRWAATAVRSADTRAASVSVLRGCPIAHV